MLRNPFLFIFVAMLLCAGSPAWAGKSKACLYKNSSVDLDKLKKSPQVLGLEPIEKGVRYSGNLRGIGGFYLELFSCTNYGARFTVLLGPDDDIASLDATLKLLPDLLFSQADALKVRGELQGVQLAGDSPPVFLDDLAKDLGLTQAFVQLVEAEGMGLLVFQYYGGL
ncbi:MAG TPA: hypothetical protein VFV39_07865 [Limnobacter sp.]|nr:hypothetical protein [Limnobacter sp.]